MTVISGRLSVRSESAIQKSCIDLSFVNLTLYNCLCFGAKNSGHSLYVCHFFPFPAMMGRSLLAPSTSGWTLNWKRLSICLGPQAPTPLALRWAQSTPWTRTLPSAWVEYTKLYPIPYSYGIKLNNLPNTAFLQILLTNSNTSLPRNFFHRNCHINGQQLLQTKHTTHPTKFAPLFVKDLKTLGDISQECRVVVVKQWSLAPTSLASYCMSALLCPRRSFFNASAKISGPRLVGYARP